MLDKTFLFLYDQSSKKFSLTYRGIRCDRDFKLFKPEINRAVDYRSYPIASCCNFKSGAVDAMESVGYKDRVKKKVHFSTFFPQRLSQDNDFHTEQLIALLAFAFIRGEEKVWVSKQKKCKYLKGNKKEGSGLPGGKGMPRADCLSKTKKTKITKERVYEWNNESRNTVGQKVPGVCPLKTLAQAKILRQSFRKIHNQSKQHQKSLLISQEETHEKLRFEGCPSLEAVTPTV